MVSKKKGGLKYHPKKGKKISQKSGAKLYSGERKNKQKRATAETEAEENEEGGKENGASVEENSIN